MSYRDLRIIQLRKKGNSYREIANLMDSVSHTTVGTVVRKYIDGGEVSESDEPGLLSFSRSKDSLSPSSQSEATITVASEYPTERLRENYGNLNPTLYTSDLSDDEWIREYCDYSWDKVYLTELRAFLMNVDRGLALLPRDSGKTLSVIGLFARHILEVRTPILCITSTSLKTKIYREIKRILMSPKVRAKYGDMVENFTGHMGEMWLYNELRQGSPDASFKVVGTSGQVIGGHPDWIHFEDPVQQEFLNEESNVNMRDWFDRVIKYMIAGRITATGTRKSISDFYSFLLDRNFDLFHMKAVELLRGEFPTYNDVVTEVDDTGRLREIDIDVSMGEYQVIDCPNKTFEIKELLIGRARNYEAFQAEMQNDPLPDQGTYFIKDDWTEIEPYPSGVLEDFYISCDSAYGSSNSADNTAILVAALHQGKLIIVDGIMGKLKFDGIIGALKGFYATYKPHQVFLETNFAQIWLKQGTDSAGIPVTQVRQTKNKIMRIDSLKPFYTQKRIQIIKTCPIKHKLYAEYMQYNQRQSSGMRHDDGLDSLATMMEKVGGDLVQFNWSILNTLGR